MPQSVQSRKKLGKWGEEIAGTYLQKKGIKLLFQNWRFMKSEVDIIAYEHPFILFIEVKTRQSNKFGEPFESVSANQEKKLQEAALGFLEKYELEHEIRFDIVSIVIQKGLYSLKHIENAF